MSSSDRASLLAAGVLMPLLAAAAVGLRFFARTRGGGAGRDTDDWLCIPALAMVAGCGAVLVAGVAAGAEASLPSSQLLLEQLSLSFCILQAFATAATSLSALLLYRRLFASKRLRTATLVAGALVLQWLLAFAVSMVVLGARRLQASGQDAAAFSASNTFVDGLLVALAVEGILIHAVILVLPAPLLVSLDLPLGRALAAAAVYLVAATSVSFGIVRLAAPAVAASDGAEASALDLVTGALAAGDPRAVAAYMLWGTVEAGSLLAAACLPALGPLVLREQGVVRKLSSAMSGDLEAAERGRSPGPAAAAAGALRNESCGELDPNFKFMESHISIQYLAAGGRRGESPAPEGTIMVENKITQVIEHV